jgi:hypothetical protein
VRAAALGRLRWLRGALASMEAALAGASAPLEVARLAAKVANAEDFLAGEWIGVVGQPGRAADRNRRDEEGGP